MAFPILNLPEFAVANIFRAVIKDPTEKYVFGEHIAQTCKTFYDIIKRNDKMIFKFTLNKLQVQFPTSGSLWENALPICRMYIRGLKFKFTTVKDANKQVKWLLKRLSGLTVTFNL